MGAIVSRPALDYCLSLGRPLVGSLAIAPLAILITSHSSHAASLTTKPFIGFSDAFQPAEWNFSKEGNGSGSISYGFGGGGGADGTMTLTSTANKPPGTFEFIYDTSKLNSYAPSSNYVFQSGQLSYDWTWSFAPPTPGVALPFTFEQKDSSSSRTTSTLLSEFNGTAIQVGDPVAYTTRGSQNVSVSADSEFGFKIESSLTDPSIFSGATATVTNFSFVAEYREVPGPLPAAAVVAAFGWSRKLRRRMKEANLKA